ncbi:MAG: DNA alkylation repair protein [Spirochaetaceae bacterium]|jgi:3-methyladenine DNA glycosylase AlkC|nr:DNA alkylation repair protein [Spirochaetaceae bacterium]
MAKRLKDIYDRDFLRRFGGKVRSVYPSFDTAGFIRGVMDDGWENLALKARIRKISLSLGACLPEDYGEAVHILRAAAGDCAGFPYLFFPDFVVVYGLEKKRWKISLDALELFTQKSSAEFAIRPFIRKDPDRILKRMLRWAQSPNEHVRRLSSEGCRPRLPWGEVLSAFKKDPAPVLRVLELLKADPSLYVRKSVANNLNDISKDNPDLVLETVQRWKGKDPGTDWIIRHGCRGLIRKADPRALDLFEYAGTAEGGVSQAVIRVRPARVAIGESCEIRYGIVVREGEAARIRLEYAIDFVKARGRLSRKVFLLHDKTVQGGERIAGKRIHRWADLSTRRHYPGNHPILLLVNGREAAGTEIKLSAR